MMTMPTPRYDRAPSKELQELLKPGEFLAPLIDIDKRKVGGYEHDVHFRPGDEVHVYRGLTRVLKAKRLQRRDGCVSVEAHHKYAKQSCSRELFRPWCTDEHGFKEALDLYLSGVKVNPSRIRGEGAVQMQWARVKEPWVPFDREAVLGYQPSADGANAKAFPKANAALAKLDKIYKDHVTRAGRARWDEPSMGGGEVDQLAVDSDGRLVLIELKDGSKPNSQVYYAPFQLLQYIWEWHSALKAVRGDLQELIKARKRLKLMSQDVPDLTGCIRAAVGFGPAVPSDETKSRYRIVLDIVNDHLPPGVEAIETWALTDTGPCQLNEPTP